jgi:diaminopimelate decarboxylase
VSVEALLAEHGSPLWLVDVDRVRERLSGFRDAWSAAWPASTVSYSYKTNRTTAVLRALADAGAGAEVVCAAEYALARHIPVDGRDITVNGPAKPDALLEAAAHDDALVIVDSVAELARLAAAGVERAGIRVAMSGPEGHPSRFGIAPEAVAHAVRTARELGLALEVLHAHLVSTDFTGALGEAVNLAAGVRVGWQKPPAVPAAAASALGRLARGLDVPGIDLGGGWPAAPGVAGHAAAVAEALDATGFDGALVLEPGRAIVSDAVDLACTVVAVKTLPDGRRCAIADAGTNLLPGALWTWPRLEPLRPRGGDAPALVSGPLCLNIDVLAPAAPLGDVEPGDVLVARGVGAYQQVQSTQFGDLRPAVVARDGGRWRLHRRRETLSDLVRLDQEEASWSA